MFLVVNLIINTIAKEWHCLLSGMNGMWPIKKDLCYLQPQIVFQNKWMKKTEGKWLMQDKLKNDK